MLLAGESEAGLDRSAAPGEGGQVQYVDGFLGGGQLLPAFAGAETQPLCPVTLRTPRITRGFVWAFRRALALGCTGKIAAINLHPQC